MSFALHASTGLLDDAYRHCAELTKANSRTFYLASTLLPEAKRRGARALYAFCRVTDDLVDKADNQQHALLALRHWRERAHHPPPDWDTTLVAWADTRARFDIPQGYADQLVDGVARDLSTSRYSTFEHLAHYCYGVASTVGLMVMHLVGFSDEDALPYAVKLGVALQLTNILRDVGEDWKGGRVYLPLDELRAYDLADDDLAHPAVDGRWRRFMAFQIERTRHLYAESRRGIALLDPDGRFAIAAAAGLYESILADIEAYDYDVFSRRAHLSAWSKFRRLPAIWWQTKRLHPPARLNVVEHRV
jgi:phytoene synthase